MSLAALTPVGWPEPAFSGLSRRVISPGVYAWEAQAPYVQAVSTALPVSGFSHLSRRLKPLIEKPAEAGSFEILAFHTSRKRLAYQPFGEAR